MLKSFPKQKLRTNIVRNFCLCKKIFEIINMLLPTPVLCSNNIIYILYAYRKAN